jgi:hypothetical protein
MVTWNCGITKTLFTVTNLLHVETDISVTHRHLHHPSHGMVQTRQMAAAAETKRHRDDK